jgi:hypothetical protein
MVAGDRKLSKTAGLRAPLVAFDRNARRIDA